MVILNGDYFYRGLDRFVARSRLWSDLEAAGLALKAEPYTLRVPRSQRGGEVCTNNDCFLFTKNGLKLIHFKHVLIG